MTKPKRKRLPEPSHTRDCDECDLIFALYEGAVDESEFMRRMFHEHNRDYIEVIAIIMEKRARSCGNG